LPGFDPAWRGPERQDGGAFSNRKLFHACRRWRISNALPPGWVSRPHHRACTGSAQLSLRHPHRNRRGAQHGCFIENAPGVEWIPGQQYVPGFSSSSIVHCSTVQSLATALEKKRIRKTGLPRPCLWRPVSVGRGPYQEAESPYPRRPRRDDGGPMARKAGGHKKARTWGSRQAGGMGRGAAKGVSPSVCNAIPMGEFLDLRD